MQSSIDLVCGFKVDLRNTLIMANKQDVTSLGSDKSIPMHGSSRPYIRITGIRRTISVIPDSILRRGTAKVVCFLNRH